MKITAGKHHKHQRAIFAADEDEFEVDDISEEVSDEDLEDAGDTETIEDSIDDLSDAVEDVQDTVEEVEEDPVDIEQDSNIADHYIAECESCHGIFISAVLDSDQDVTKITGVCPICGKETDQYLKWVVKDIEEEKEDAENV